MGSETPKIDDFTVKMTKFLPLVGQVTTFGSNGSEFLISFGPLHNPTPQIGYPYGRVHGVPQIGLCPPPDQFTNTGNMTTTKTSTKKLQLATLT